jgi:acyl-CoA synthetase (NDP forming)
VLAMKGGTSRAGARASASHTAALAGSDAAADALFHESGVLRATTLGELLDVATLLATQPLPAGNRVGVLTNAGGLGVLCADACEAAGLELPSLMPSTAGALAAVMPREASVANPVDMLGSATAEVYEAALPLLLADSDVDAVIALFAPAAVAAADQVAAALARASAGSTKPVLAVVMTSAGVPAPLEGGGRVTAFTYPESAARALGRAVQRATWLRRPEGVLRRPDGIEPHRGRDVVRHMLERGGGWLDPAEVRELLESYGLPVIPERLAADPAEAVVRARELGLPAVVKLGEAGAHKTERGGVALDLRDETAVAEAAARMGGPVIVQPMIDAKVELLAGVVQDPVFGPLVAFGPGGVLAELIGDAAFRSAPVTDVDAREMVATGRAGRLVRGFRGAPPVDADALEDMLLRLSALADDLPELAELDLNPVMARPDGIVIADSRARVAAAPERSSPKTW